MILDGQKTIWMPAVTITIQVEAYNGGMVRMVRIAGPKGGCGFVPMQAGNHKAIIDFVQKIVSSELEIALPALDLRCKRIPGMQWSCSDVPESEE